MLSISKSLPALTLALSLATLVAFSLQYPLSTTFPMGGDAAYHISLAQTTLANLPHNPLAAILTLNQSNYPLSHLAMIVSRVLPISWPDRFIWLMASAHIAVGISIALLLNRVYGWPAAAAGMALWAPTAIGFNSHFEDATIAQLLSLIPFTLFLERLPVRPYWMPALLLPITALTHPLTGMVLLLITLTSLPILIKQRNLWLITSALLMSLSGIIVLLSHHSWLQISLDTASSANVVLWSRFDPYIVLALLGFLLFPWHKFRPLSSMLLWAVPLSVLLTFNNYLAVGFMTHRFQTYLILIITIFAAFALAFITKQAISKLPAALFSILLIAAILLPSWVNGASIYHRFESSDRYMRLHPAEQAAIAWMSRNLPSNSSINTSTATRHVEWIPVLTEANWKATPSLKNELYAMAQNQIKKVSSPPDEHLPIPSYTAIFTLAEEIPPPVNSYPQFFPIIFQNDAVTIIKLPKPL